MTFSAVPILTKIDILIKNLDGTIDNVFRKATVLLYVFIN